MGSDQGPWVEVAGAVEAMATSGLDVVLVGDESKIEPHLRAKGKGVSGSLSIRHTPEAITTHDAPSMAVKGKKQSSMRLCFDMVKAGEMDAVVSAGNSGAMMACGLFVLGRLPGVDRPAIITTFPTIKGECAILDMGANVDPKPQVLAQFAVMGAVYARLQHGKPNPRVGLLSNGSEEHKGTNLTRETHALLAKAKHEGAPGFDYVGYVEGRDVFRGDVDVVVTDGFTGNVLLKGCEGVVDAVFKMVKAEVLGGGPLVKLGAMMMRPALRKLKRKTDYAETGGAPLLGVNGVAMICHGGSGPKAIKNAILQAESFARSGLSAALATDIERSSYIWEPKPSASDKGNVS